jgi:hypothetical protein
MPTNPMLSAGHMGIVDAMKYGATRDYSTLAAALAAIGSEDAILLLPKEGDGIWTINTAVTIPANVTLWIPPGVMWAGTGHLTMNGKLVAFVNDFMDPATPRTLNFDNISIGGLQVARLGVQIPPTTAWNGIWVKGDAVTPPHVVVEEFTLNGGATYEWWSVGTPLGIMGLGGNQNIVLALQGGAKFAVTGGSPNGAMGLGALPSSGQQLELSTGAAQKATGTAWTNPSDSRIKTIQRAYTDGLALVRQVEPVWAVFNGLAGTNVEISEFVTVIAQDLQPHAPYMIGSFPARLHPADESETQILNFDGSTLIFALVNAVKELAALVEGLESRLTALEEPS